MKYQKYVPPEGKTVVENQRLNFDEFLKYFRHAEKLGHRLVGQIEGRTRWYELVPDMESQKIRLLLPGGKENQLAEIVSCVQIDNMRMVGRPKEKPKGA
ncbi:MAG: hypothetical protein IT443_12045 [Phycisphaeraceae bacterium]|nr:hypothetical protein [Phycisphaeraceae bacterium]